MIDRLALRLAAVPLNAAARVLKRAGITANEVTWAGLVVGLGVIPLLAQERYDFAAATSVSDLEAELNGAIAEGSFNIMINITDLGTGADQGGQRTADERHRQGRRKTRHSGQLGTCRGDRCRPDAHT